MMDSAGTDRALMETGIIVTVVITEAALMEIVTTEITGAVLAVRIPIRIADLCRKVL
jgi:hypothetical protein